MIKAIICLTCLYYAVANLHALWNVPNAAYTMADDWSCLWPLLPPAAYLWYKAATQD